MHTTRNLKPIIAAIVGLIAIWTADHTLFAQTTLSGNHIITGNLDVGTSSTKGNLNITGATGSSALPGISVSGDGGAVFSGTYGMGQIPATGSGVRMMWYPKKAAFRVGETYMTFWDDANVGAHSFGAGYWGVASGQYSVTLGYGNSAPGNSSFAQGLSVTASGTAAVAMGWSNNASGNYSLALGHHNSASGFNSFAAGGSSTASGTNSIAIGSSTASGTFACAIGSLNIATGAYSFAANYKANAVSAYSFVVGRNNAADGNTTTWVDSDPLFVVGNGTGVVSDPAAIKNRNAFTVFKNGDVEVAGTINLSGTVPFTGNNGFVFGGTFGSGTIPIEGAGTRLMWYPGKGAFRAGVVSGTQWNNGSIGNYSTAMGNGTTASGANSVAFGNGTVASGADSIALGGQTVASGYESAAFGSVTTASGNFTVAMGRYSTASGGNSVAMGYGSTTTGEASFASGEGSTASGYGGAAFGKATAGGSFSIAMGYYSVSGAYSSAAFGRYNVGAFTDNADGNSNNDGNKIWINNDPILEVGSGTASNARKNSLTVFKNGKLRTEGTIESKVGVRTPPQGDLSMGEFTSGSNPADLNPATGLKYAGE